MNFYSLESGDNPYEIKKLLARSLYATTYTISKLADDYLSYAKIKGWTYFKIVLYFRHESGKVEIMDSFEWVQLKKKPRMLNVTQEEHD